MAACFTMPLISSREMGGLESWKAAFTLAASLIGVGFAFAGFRATKSDRTRWLKFSGALLGFGAAVVGMVLPFNKSEPKRYVWGLTEQQASRIDAAIAHAPAPMLVNIVCIGAPGLGPANLGNDLATAINRAAGWFAAVSLTNRAPPFVGVRVLFDRATISSEQLVAASALAHVLFDVGVSTSGVAEPLILGAFLDMPIGGKTFNSAKITVTIGPHLD
jgi:hypothetical protein